MTYEQIMRQIREAQKSMAILAKLYPGCFDANGKAIMASASFPKLGEKAPQKNETSRNT
jgi:hypothetical protein